MPPSPSCCPVGRQARTRKFLILIKSLRDTRENTTSCKAGRAMQVPSAHSRNAAAYRKSISRSLETGTQFP